MTIGAAFSDGSGYFRAHMEDERVRAWWGRGGTLKAYRAYIQRRCRTARDLVETPFDSTRVRVSMPNATLSSGTARRPTTSASVP